MAKGVSYLKRNGIRKTCVRIVRKIVLSQKVDYEKWLKEHTPSEEILNCQRKENTGNKPVVSVRIFSEGEEQRERTGRSVQDQTYGFLAVSSTSQDSDFTLVLRNGVVLCEHAVYEMMRYAYENPEMDLFYADDDVLMNGKYQDPFFKPEFDSCLFLQWDYLGDVLLLRKSLAEQITDFSDYEEIAAKAEKVGRIPKILSHTDGKYRRIRKLVEHSLTEQPQISVIIPNKDHASDLKICVESLIHQGGYENLGILIVENNSQEEETFALYERLKTDYPFIRILNWQEAFNYSAINNYAAGEAKGEYLLFLNNDTKVKRDGFLAELMKWGSLPECGAIGARLLYADETLQHGGVVIGYGGIAGHAFEGFSSDAYEDTVYAHLIRRMSAVTAACMLVKKEAFEAAGGFSEELKVAYNDIDLCMKLQEKGYMVLYDPYAEMYHYESQTRGFEMTTQKAKRVEEEAAIFISRWKEILEKGDPFYNPNLTLEKPDFSLAGK